MALNYGNTDAMDKLLKIVGEDGIIQLFKKYNVSSSKFNMFDQYKYFGLGAISDECGICCMNCDLILMPRCTHRLCAECYTKVKQCPYCRA
jgi:hypothetical protein